MQTQIQSSIQTKSHQQPVIPNGYAMIDPSTLLSRTNMNNLTLISRTNMKPNGTSTLLSRTAALLSRTAALLSRTNMNNSARHLLNMNKSNNLTLISPRGLSLIRMKPNGLSTLLSRTAAALLMVIDKSIN